MPLIFLLLFALPIYATSQIAGALSNPQMNQLVTASLQSLAPKVIQPTQTILWPSVTYERLSFSYDVGNPGKSPNVVSSLDWKTITVARIGFEALYKGNTVAIGGGATYGKILSGNAIDDDFGGDNKAKIYSRSQTKTRGNTLDLNLWLGFPVSLSMTPLLGVFYSQRKFEMYDGDQLISTPANIPAGPPIALSPVGPLTGNHAHYITSMMGPLVGIMMEWTFASNFKFFAGLKAKYILYHGQSPQWRGNSLNDHSKGWGADGSIGLGYLLAPTASMTLKVGGHYANIRRGDSLWNGKKTSGFFIKAKETALSISLGVQVVY